MYYFVVSDYSATGEGRTISILITRARPRRQDYEIEPKFDFANGKWTYTEGTLKYSREEIAVRSLKEKIDSYFHPCVDLLDKDQFLKSYRAFVPTAILDIVEEKDPRGHPFAFEWHSNYHFNYS